MELTETEAEISGPPTRRRNSIGRLIAGAAALGLVAGVCAGYVVQSGRAPTKLPSLSQPVLAQAKGDGPEPLSAAQDRHVKVDGDLRKLLLKRPAGTRAGLLPEGDDGWLSQADLADMFDKPGPEFASLSGIEFRRAAVANWRENRTYDVEIHLIQFRQEERRGASGFTSDANYWAEQEGNTDGGAIPGTGDGMVYVHHAPITKYGLSVYWAEAHAWRGDIAMEIWVYDIKPIPKSKIMDLAKRQMGRL